jgi:predicted ester cyclase
VRRAEQTSEMFRAQAERLAREHLRIFAEGDEAAVAANVTPDYFNLRSADEPLAARQQGPQGFKVTLRWAARAFADMRFQVHEVMVTGNRVALHVTFSGRQHGPFVVHDAPDGRVTEVFPATGRQFAVKHTHWMTVRDGAICEHDAVRDDLGMAKQLGWIPPQPMYIVRMLLAAARERRANRPPIASGLTANEPFQAEE